ncbi:RlpA-like double-psi beta-barrel-protein domain-containing protein-containing protein [Papiliotrema laurentii]|uniref:RlpA-like double-psi beta-barrel-protein domain-containing protein-containing protein n=1 Tax=Papiliotrema laurentii TaxID=5418 RepID=A0AAD9FWF8_PAPLA|nr:RlpA-like double-psi beta-barrel-protein domain-containing protein-containing protein [Papiliotrema laurentii]
MYAAALFALASTAIAAPLANRAEDAAPSHWATGYLENYDVYHTRYLALGCQDQHNTTFFEDCCHPLLANETLVDDRAAYCTPNTTQVASASSYEASAASASTTASVDAEAESEYCDAVTSSSAYASASATASSTWSSAAAAATSDVAQAQVQAAEPAPSSAAPTSEWVAPTTTSSEEQPAQTNAPSGDVKTGGFATFFYQGGNAGACGTVHSDWDKVIAIDSNGYWSDYASNSNSPNCGRWINIKNTNNGKTVTAMVADVCPTCVSDNSLDLSLGAFTAIADEADGSVPITWTWA